MKNKELKEFEKLFNKFYSEYGNTLLYASDIKDKIREIKEHEK